MTDPVKGISGSQGTSAGGSFIGGGFPEDHKHKRANPPQADLIEISREARNRSTGKKKKSIFEFLKELLD
jgi:hypothetical protein